MTAGRGECGRVWAESQRKGLPQVPELRLPSSSILSLASPTLDFAALFHLFSFSLLLSPSLHSPYPSRHSLTFTAFPSYEFRLPFIHCDSPCFASFTWTLLPVQV